MLKKESIPKENIIEHYKGFLEITLAMGRTEYFFQYNPSPSVMISLLVELLKIESL